VDIESVGVFTTTPPIGAYRGASRGGVLIERLVDEAAHLEGRSCRAAPAQSHPQRALSVQDRDRTGLRLGRLRRSAGPHARHGRLFQFAARSGATARGEIVGVGVATYVEPSGLGWESGQVRVESTGAGAFAVTGSSAHGREVMDDVRADHRR
jgi:carbon-monoxide dehydrogenase large subunit